MARNRPLRLRWSHSLSEIPREAWDALAVPLETPALEWEWLRLLEASGSVRPETGWLPCHLTLWSESDLIAAAPLYVKGHSEGEFVWDHLWVDVADRLGVKYYPKVIGMSPATPLIGYRFLIAPGEEEAEITTLLVGAIERLCRDNHFAGCSFNYVDAAWVSRMEALGCLAWKHQSFAWENEGFTSFDDYVSTFRRGQRRNIRRERAALEELGLRIRPYTGNEIPRPYLDRMYHFYEGTNARFGPWAAKYLTAEFFRGLHEAYRHRLLLMAAFLGTDPEPIGMSFLLTKGDRLYGRYWGSKERIDGLHFETCYYSPIEWAIGHGIQYYDPGIGGAHKIRRGFRAVPNLSLHRFFDPRLHQVMAAHIEEINRLEQEQIDNLNRSLPLARTPDATG